uniref:LIM domain-containing protein 1 n=1 Tax=Castor canadensis TaxID=51338 RepID=A0A8B7UBM9_CASCN|nr:LIM domain-containing protein 1-like [Castor canadensis]
MGNLYHDACFTCAACSRKLRGKAFYFVSGKVFCEEDFLYSGFQQSADRCFLCGHLIMDMVSSQLNKSRPSWEEEACREERNEQLSSVFPLWICGGS